MKQKTINQNKLLTLLCVIALTLGVLVSAVLFSMPPVHAEIAANYPGQALIYSNGNGNKFYLKYTRLDPLNKVNDPVSVVCDDNTLNSSKLYGIMLSNVTSNSKGITSGTLGLYEYDSVSDSCSSISVNVSTGLTSTVFYESEERYGIIETNLPVFISEDGSILKLINYFRSLDDSESVNKPESPNTTDESYTFTGFSINGKTARWTGTTERSYLKDQEVEEYTTITYAWATTTEPDNLGELQSYDGEFPTSDKQLTLPWSEMESGKTDFQFIRQIKIFPCYRVPHLAYYIGQPVTIYYNTDGSIDKISNPNTPGVLDDSIPIPVLSVNNDKGTFLFANAQNNYKFELKGRFWSTDDFYVFRKMPSLVWQYKYLTLLKNSLTTWVSVGDNMSTLSTYSFGDLGKESWNDLLNTYPIENRNIITGEQQGWLSWANITGYNDAITTLKTLLSTPYSLFNGYEVYVRYYVVCDDGSIKYSKWTHYFNNLADADGSTGSIVDDASNMNNGSQSDKGLTDSDMDNVENSGNSRNDVDAKPSNDFSVEISDITGLFNQFINILKSLYSGIGQLPSLVNAIFGFLPSWASTMIGISLVVIIILRIIGR